ncbi:hypothetical protein [uncultured Dokdonia sp.]|uniref:hypothetical protein n=1 Tax=uncultured Dokdonia sp. TaxID=575653 RepID=UPI0026117FBD|nr:hypothetical protein [uncultured Dokdonia sp.]
MRTLITLLLVAFSSTTFAQSFQWGFPFQITDETDAKLEHYIVNDKLHRLYSKYDLSIFNYKVQTDQFSLNELEQTTTQDISIKQPVLGASALTHVDHFQNEDGDFTFFSYEIDRKTKENNLYAQNVNITTGERSDKKFVTKMQGKSISNSGNWKIKQSQNKAYFVAFKELPFFKKENEKIAMVLLDKDKNVIKEITHTFAQLDKRNKEHDVFISNNGTISFIKNIKLKKQKPFKNFYVWKKDAEAVQEISLKLEDNHQIYQYDVTFDTDDNLYFNSLFTHEGSNFFGMKVDITGRHSGIHSNGLYSMKLDNTGAVVYQNRNDFPNVIPNLSIKDFVFNNDTLWMLLDRMHVIKKSDNSTIGSTGSPTYDYTFQSNGFMIGTINVQNGAINWSKQINTNERDTRNDNGDYLSYLYFFKDNNLTLLYNETRDINKGIIHVVFLRRFPIKSVFSTDGEQLSAEAILAAGIGVKKDEPFELNTNMQLQVKEDTYVIRARSGVEYKYGYMKL